VREQLPERASEVCAWRAKYPVGVLVCLARVWREPGAMGSNLTRWLIVRCTREHLAFAVESVLGDCGAGYERRSSVEGCLTV
jgi:hypothetical protein